MNRKKCWTLAFCSAENDLIIVLVHLRGRGVVKQTTDEDVHGPVIVDGWKVYPCLTIIQGRWSHVVGEVNAFNHLRVEKYCKR